MSMKKEKEILSDPLSLIPDELKKELNLLPSATEDLKNRDLQRKNLPMIIQKALTRLDDLNLHYKGGPDKKHKDYRWKGYLNADPNDPEDAENYKQKLEYEDLIKRQKEYIRKLMVDWQMASGA